jgi:molybdopterin-guanine dinucleotide biosynthesis protein A
MKRDAMTDKIPGITDRGNCEPPPVHDIAGVILAGGKSSRYGSNKALAKFNGTPLIERVLRVMGAVFHDIILITNSPEEYAYLQLPMKEDLIKGLGPLGGIYTGLESISHEAGLFVACDMPFLNEGLIRHMLGIGKNYDAVVPKIDWKIETLHTLYRKSCLSAIKNLIQAKNFQAKRFFDRIRVRYVGEDEIMAFDPRLRAFANVNRPEEMDIMLEHEKATSRGRRD